MKDSILFILHLPPPVHGAATIGKYIRDSELINSEFDCHFVNLTTAGHLDDVGKFKIWKLVSFCHLIRNIIQSVKRYKPNLVYMTPNAKGGPFYKDSIVMTLLKFMDCKIVVHYHNKGVITHQDRGFDNLLYKRFFKGIKVILLSDRLYADISKYVVSKDVYICPNGIPYNQDIKKGKHNEVPRILFLSNLLIEKGILVLLDAMKILKDQGCAFTCDIVGNETADIDLNRLDKEIHVRELNNIVVPHGGKYGKEKQHFYEDADMFVFPTLNECFPLVLLEAMQHSLPIVTTDEGGIPDIVQDGENGLICKKNDADDLANKLSSLLNDKSSREKMGMDGFEKFKDNFTLDIFEKRMADILHRLLP